MDLKPSQRANADKRARQDSDTVNARLSAAFTWVIYPDQFDPTEAFTIEKERASESAGALPERVAGKLRQSDRLTTDLNPGALGMVLHDPNQLGALWERDHQVKVGELWSYFTKYVYMPRVTSRSVFEDAITRATSELLASADEQFAIASGVDPESGEYRGLIIPPSGGTTVSVTDSTLLVDYNKAVEQHQRELQRAAEEQARRSAQANSGSAESGGAGTQASSGGADAPGWPPRPAGVNVSGGGVPKQSVEQPKTKFFGATTVDRNGYSKQLRLIVQEVIALLEDADDLEITVEIHASKDSGFTEQEQRTISENAHTLRFDHASFMNI